MTEPIRHCADHGFVAGDACPLCEEGGQTVLTGDRRRRLSKFISGALRHFPADVGLSLDERGWTTEDALVRAVEEKYDWADSTHVSAVVATDPKGRFERSDDGQIRAAYGHSVDVTLEPAPTPVPDTLYHGTAPDNLASIRREGLRPMARQQVHLSESEPAARAVGQRHANEPVVLVVDAAGMLADGHRITRRGTETYTTDRVQPAYLDL